MANDLYGGRRTTRYFLTIGGTMVSQVSKIQQVVSLSTKEVEYVATTEASKELIYLQRLLEELGKVQKDEKLWSDIQSDIHLAKKSTFHSRNKQIKLLHHFIQVALKDG